jgi:hypothetical protein
MSQWRLLAPWLGAGVILMWELYTMNTCSLTCTKVYSRLCPMKQIDRLLVNTTLYIIQKCYWLNQNCRQLQHNNPCLYHPPYTFTCIVHKVFLSFLQRANLFLKTLCRMNPAMKILVCDDLLSLYNYFGELDRVIGIGSNSYCSCNA